MENGIRYIGPLERDDGDDVASMYILRILRPTDIEESTWPSSLLSCASSNKGNLSNVHCAHNLFRFRVQSINAWPIKTSANVEYVVRPKLSPSLFFYCVLCSIVEWFAASVSDTLIHEREQATACNILQLGTCGTKRISFVRKTYLYLGVLRKLDFIGGRCWKIGK